jgi:hypothetical protein
MQIILRNAKYKFDKIIYNFMAKLQAKIREEEKLP